MFSKPRFFLNKTLRYVFLEYRIFAAVKGIALILSFIIFSTSLKASAFVGGMVGAIGEGMSTSSCCKIDEKVIDLTHCDLDQEKEDEQERKGCCDEDDCDCACCLHITYVLNGSSYVFGASDFSDVKFDYSFLYQADFLTSVFHPPLI